MLFHGGIPLIPTERRRKVAWDFEPIFHVIFFCFWGEGWVMELDRKKSKERPEARTTWTNLPNLPAMQGKLFGLCLAMSIHEQPR